jgi:thiamine biosynthesis lipoprotein
MGGTASVTIVVDDAPVGRQFELLDDAERMLRELHRRWTRFDASSELMRLNAADGDVVEVSAPTRALVRAMVDAWRCTDGVVDASVLPQVVASGYARSTIHPSACTSVAVGATRAGLEGVVIDDVVGTVQLPPGVALDAGGLGKGLAADLAVDQLVAAGCVGALVEVGGDLRAWGHGPEGGDWAVGVENPFCPGTVLTQFGLSDAGVATSSTLKRRWHDDAGSPVHHLVGPDGRSAWHGIATSTVVAGSGVAAEVFAKLPLLVGLSDGLAQLDELGLAGSLVLDDGTTTSTRAWSTEAA